MSLIEDRLRQLGLELPPARAPVANYVSTKRSGDFLFVPGRVSDLDRVASVERMQGFVRAAPDFTDHPKVIDGASELLVEVFGEAGRHARTATGAASLPFGAAVQLDLVLRVE